MKALVIKPMRNLMEILPSGKDCLVIILDGLDECGDLEALERLMELVLILEELPATFAVFISCHPESLIVSAWDEARGQGLVIPCEDVDKITQEKYHTIRCMVEDGLRDRIRKSRWKPSEEDLDAFTLACRELPVMASIRIREVISQTWHGRTLQTEFQYLLNLSDPPTSLNWEYLRILRRAYMPDSSAMPVDVAKMYHLLVGTISSAHSSLRIAKDEAQATLEPISSIIELPSEDWKGVKFYHAKAQEFITGSPIGQERIFLGPLLLRIFNNCCKRNEFRIPTNPPLGDKEKWADFKPYGERPEHIRYVNRYILLHLDPARLFSQESNDNYELQNEFNSFLTQNFLTYLHLGGDPWVRPGFDEFNINYMATSLTLSSKISNHLIPLSEALLNAQMLMEAKSDQLPTKIDEWDDEVINYEAEFREPDVRNGIVTCTALSRDGRYIALGFGSGVIEIADIDDQHTMSQFQNHPPNPPAWIEFVHGHHHVAAEDVDGNITIYSHGTLPVKLGILPIGTYPIVTAVSDSGLFIIRVLRDPGKPWYNNVACIYISGDPHIQLLASPPDSPIQSFRSNSESAFPERHMVAFSPGARYIAAFDEHSAFTWSTESGDFIARYNVRGDKSWIINTGMAPTCPYHIPHPVSTRPTLPLAGDTVYAHHSWVDAGPELDETWIKRPFFHQLPDHASRKPADAPISS
ncbi:uncharacterized protein EI90DRAFT_3170488 [Cantharellus anzutake]|uniref:uncharacterized protein n=1 Tax=Cantharellus anzutake TaxID=1750568 RepID=UPI001903FEEC|nr:uncharacterized protein EI90DRAFT_3170488 [Cantharellus anzutake]KAF8317244.1 hypothetical protein EI90DRAFT_3170488 [Cantharellus anzutake]